MTKGDIVWKCAVCGLDCDEALAVCPSCSSPRTAQTEAPAITRPRFCPNCTRLLPAGATECRFCSTEAPAGAGDTDSPSPSPRTPGTRDGTIRRMQAFLRVLAWVAVAVYVLRAVLMWNGGSFGLQGAFGTTHSSVVISAAIASLYEAAYSWIVLMVIAEALGMLFVIEENTRRAAGGIGNRERSSE